MFSSSPIVARSVSSELDPEEIGEGDLEPLDEEALPTLAAAPRSDKPMLADPLADARGPRLSSRPDQVPRAGGGSSYENK